MLDACVLSVLKAHDTYGYELTQTLKDNLELSESTLYPVLRRLTKDSYLTTYDKPVSGRNRRYYAITEKGTLQLSYYRAGWTEFENKLGSLIMGGEQNE